ncbi:unnamed protein product [Mytilus coruscus]|uniref:Uncharacterized protein n=1 Tax=Mytilus coruscus TaxID=42192 RepID=A0A6J8DRX0_MYTCO|nr:unnamed protein product [Mytilus coruscus]
MMAMVASWQMYVMMATVASCQKAVMMAMVTSWQKSVMMAMVTSWQMSDDGDGNILANVCDDGDGNILANVCGDGDGNILAEGSDDDDDISTAEVCDANDCNIFFNYTRQSQIYAMEASFHMSDDGSIPADVIDDVCREVKRGGECSIIIKRTHLINDVVKDSLGRITQINCNGIMLIDKNES